MLNPAPNKIHLKGLEFGALFASHFQHNKK